MEQDRPSGEYFKNAFGRDVFLPDDYLVKADDELLPLCSMCIKSRMTCENYFIREVAIPIDEGEEGVIADKRQEDGSYKKIRLNTKYADGIEAGVYKKEEDIPIPFVCEWFKSKPLG